MGYMAAGTRKVGQIVITHNGRGVAEVSTTAGVDFGQIYQMPGGGWEGNRVDGAFKELPSLWEAVQWLLATAV